MTNRMFDINKSDLIVMSFCYPDSTETIFRIKSNDDSVTRFYLVAPSDNDTSPPEMWNIASRRLGYILGNNTRLEALEIHNENFNVSRINVTELFIGLQHTSSIEDIALGSIDLNSAYIMGSLAFFVSQRSLKSITLLECNIASMSFPMLLGAFFTPHSMDSLRVLDLHGNDFSGINWVTFVQALSSARNLVYLDLTRCRVGNAGCDALATLLGNQNSNLTKLLLSNAEKPGVPESPNHVVMNDDSVITMTTALANNTKLQLLGIDQNRQITGHGWRAVLRLVCDTASISSVKDSNHTLCFLSNPDFEVEPDCLSDSFGADDVNFLYACLEVNWTLSLQYSHQEAQLVVRRKLIWAHARGSRFNLAKGEEIPNSAMPRIIAWFGNGDATLIQYPVASSRYRSRIVGELYWEQTGNYDLPPVNDARVGAVQLDSIYRIIRARPRLCERPHSRAFYVLQSVLCRR